MKKFIALMLIVISLMTLTACATKRERRVEKGSISRMVYLEENGSKTKRRFIRVRNDEWRRG